MNRLLSTVKRHKLLVENFSFISILQVFQLVAPLITYPYLVRVLGLKVYGIVITAQILASYGSIIINWGTDGVCAKHVSIHRDNKAKLSEIISSVIIARSILWLLSFAIYLLIVFAVPVYREYYLLFILSYGLTFSDWLFPQFFFQGLEKMKLSSIINITMKLIFILLVFVVVKNSSDYYYVPILYSVGFLTGGVISLYQIFGKMNIKFFIPRRQTILFYLKDSTTIFVTDLICTIKDKFNYFLLGTISMGNVVVYDLGLRLVSILVRPSVIIGTVLFPKFSKSKNTNQFKKILLLQLLIIILLVIMANLFLHYIVQFFLNTQIDLLPLRVFTLAPIFLALSTYIYSNLFIAFGYNKYALYSILVTTTGYLLILLGLFFSGKLNNLYSFTFLAVASYFVEFIYRAFTARKIFKLEAQKIL